MYAATQAPLLHGVLVAADPDWRILDLASGKQTRASQRQEFWLDRRTGTLRLENASLAFRPVGVVKVLAPSALAAFDPNVAALELLAAGDRQALANGSARVTGAGSYAGVRVRWLRLELGGSSERVGVSLATGRPVVVGPRGGVTWRVQTLGPVPFSRRVLLARPLPAHTGGQVTFTHGMTLARAVHIAGFRPVWLGPVFGGGRVGAVESSRTVEVVGPSGRHARGLYFGYYADGSGVSVMEAQSPEYLGGLFPTQPSPGPGRAVLSVPGSPGDSTADAGCTAQLHTHGLWVTIRSFNARSVCARAARALRLRPPRG